MKTSSSPQAKPRGRPRSFSREVVLERAMRLFWLRGYETTSLAELLKVMKVTPPSLYSMFGDKQHLFLAAIEHYKAGPGGYPSEAMKEKTAKAAIERVLREAVSVIADISTPPGCMLALSTINCSAGSESLQQVVAQARQETERALCQRIERGVSEGELPADTEASNLAAYFATFLYGMSIKAKEGMTLGEAKAMAAIAMRAWPDTHAK